MPQQDGMPPLSEDIKNRRIMHISLPISAETIIMGSYTMPGMHEFKPGNNFSHFVNTNSREEADEIFNALSQDGTVTMPLAETFWGAYSECGRINSESTGW